MKKWNFFKSKPCIANPYDRKLHMVPYFAPLVTLDPKSKIEKQVSFFVDLPNTFFKLVRQPTFQKWILWSKFRLFKKIWNLFWWCRMVENDCLGPGECFGTALDQLGWIRNILEENFFLTFLTIFKAFLACFWRFAHMKGSKNEIFSKISLVSQIRMTESWIWSHILLPWSCLI